MAGDRIQINPLERALSKDINDIQLLQTQMRNDVLGSLSALRGISASGGIFDTFAESSVMGFDMRASANPAEVLIGLGILNQVSFTWPAPPAANESAIRIGINRAVKAVPLPGTPNIFVMLECRVVDVITVSENRDIFDVPTQTFIPTLVTKQVERQVEFQFIEGDSSALPAYSGDPWVPLYAFNTDGSGELPVFPGLFAFDFRKQMQDQIQGSELREIPSFHVGDSEVFNWSCHSPDGGLVAGVIGGNFRGRNGNNQVWLRADSSITPGNDSLTTFPANGVEHLYLCPLISKGITIFPVVYTGGSDVSSKGILLASVVPGDVVGPDNQGVIAYDPGAAFKNFDAIAAHRAVYVTTAYVDQNAFGYVPFTQSSGGRVLTRNIRTGSPNALISILNTGAVAPGTFPFDMGGIVPNGARTVILAVSVVNIGAEVANYVLKRTGLSQDFGIGSVIDISFFGTTLYWEVPVHESSADGVLDGMKWEVVTLDAGGTSLNGVAIDVVGWTF